MLEEPVYMRASHIYQVKYLPEWGVLVNESSPQEGGYYYVGFGIVKHFKIGIRREFRLCDASLAGFCSRVKSCYS